MLRKQVYGGLVGLATLRRLSHSDSVIIRRDFGDLRFLAVGLTITAVLRAIINL